VLDFTATWHHLTFPSTELGTSSHDHYKTSPNYTSTKPDSSVQHFADAIRHSAATVPNNASQDDTITSACKTVPCLHNAPQNHATTLLNFNRHNTCLYNTATPLFRTMPQLDSSMLYTASTFPHFSQQNHHQTALVNTVAPQSRTLPAHCRSAPHHAKTQLSATSPAQDSPVPCHQQCIAILYHYCRSLHVTATQHRSNLPSQKFATLYLQFTISIL